MAASATYSIEKSLLSAGFESFSGGCFTHKDGIAITCVDPLLIEIDDIEEEDIREFVEEMEKIGEASAFGKCLVEWVETKRKEDSEDAPGFIQDEGESEEGRIEIGYLQSLVEFDPERKLTIYTWGKRLKKHKPHQSQRNFNASILNGRAKGIDLRNTNGLSEDIQYVVSRCSTFENWIKMCLGVIERDSLHTISINCSKGRHRSVAAAELIRTIYYPSATVIHLTIR